MSIWGIGIAAAGLVLSATTTGIGMANQAKASKQAMLASQKDITTRANAEQEEMVASMIDNKMSASKASQGANQQLLEAMGYSMG